MKSHTGYHGVQTFIVEHAHHHAHEVTTQGNQVLIDAMHLPPESQPWHKSKSLMVRMTPSEARSLALALMRSADLAGKNPNTETDAELC